MWEQKQLCIRTKLPPNWKKREKGEGGRLTFEHSQESRTPGHFKTESHIRPPKLDCKGYTLPPESDSAGPSPKNALCCKMEIAKIALPLLSLAFIFPSLCLAMSVDAPDERKTKKVIAWDLA